MAKVSFIHQLQAAYMAQVRRIPAKGVYASKERQMEVQAAHSRKFMRQAARSVGKSNKLGFRRRVQTTVEIMCENDFWAVLCRSNVAQKGGGKK